jgi:hypothetical protein
MEQRWQEIQNLWQNNQVLYVIAGFLAGILFFPAIEALSTDVSELLSGFVPEAVGIAFTVLLIDRLYQRREQQREEAELRKRLLRQVRSQDPATALNALQEMNDAKLLAGEYGLLRERSLSQVQWPKAPLTGANLNKVNLMSANLFNANLNGAQMTDADLAGADMRKAYLIGTRLRSAHLNSAKLQEAYLVQCDLRGADLGWAILTGAKMRDVKFNGATRFPDDTYWTPETDMARFADPNHPDFWEPGWVKEQKTQR